MGVLPAPQCESGAPPPHPARCPRVPSELVPDPRCTHCLVHFSPRTRFHLQGFWCHGYGSGSDGQYVNTWRKVGSSGTPHPDSAPPLPWAPLSPLQLSANTPVSSFPKGPRPAKSSCSPPDPGSFLDAAERTHCPRRGHRFVVAGVAVGWLLLPHHKSKGKGRTAHQLGVVQTGGRVLSCPTFLWPFAIIHFLVNIHLLHLPARITLTFTGRFYMLTDRLLNAL